MIDCGRFVANLDDAVRAADHAGFAARPNAPRQRGGRLRGIGVTCFMETARGAPNEGAEIRFDDDGKVALLVGTQSNGMGHETAYAQIAADLLGLPIETFRYVQADTAVVRDGNGHGGARSMHMGGAALCKAVDAMLAKGTRDRRAPAAGVAGAGGVRRRTLHRARRPVPRHRPARVARAARDPANVPDGEWTPGLDTYVWNLLDLITFPNGCHVAEVEVDPDTGAVTLERYTAVDDFGTLINPMLTIGQMQGGVVQGIGQALLEHTVYDPELRPDAQRLVHGLRAAARRRPAAARHHAERRADHANPLGVKGAGQAGAIAAPQAIICAHPRRTGAASA